MDDLMLKAASQWADSFDNSCPNVQKWERVLTLSANN